MRHNNIIIVVKKKELGYGKIKKNKKRTKIHKRILGAQKSTLAKKLIFFLSRGKN